MLIFMIDIYNRVSKIFLQRQVVAVPIANIILLVSLLVVDDDISRADPVTAAAPPDIAFTGDDRLVVVSRFYCLLVFA